jgi:hypothetical protein
MSYYFSKLLSMPIYIKSANLSRRQNMASPQISPNTVLMNPTDLNPQAHAAQALTVMRATNAFKKAEDKSKSDSVNISEEALRKSKEAEGHTDETEVNFGEEPEEKLPDIDQADFTDMTPVIEKP